MALTEYRYRVQLIAKDRNFANAMGKAVSPFHDKPGSDEAIFDSEQVVQLSPQAWALELPATQRFVDVLDAMAEDAPLSDPRLEYLASTGRINEANWGRAKTDFFHSYHLAWIDERTFVDQPDALDILIAANGYTRA